MAASENFGRSALTWISYQMFVFTCEVTEKICSETAIQNFDVYERKLV